jgi:hypothetical protein
MIHYGIYFPDIFSGAHRQTNLVFSKQRWQSDHPTTHPRPCISPLPGGILRSVG